MWLFPNLTTYRGHDTARRLWMPLTDRMRANLHKLIEYDNPPGSDRVSFCLPRPSNMFTSIRPKQAICVCVSPGHRLLLRRCSKNILWVNLEIFTVLSDVDSVLVPVQRFSHVQGILPILRNACRVIRIVSDHGTVGRITHGFVHFDGIRITFPYKKIYEPGVLCIASLFKRLAQKLAISEPPVLRCY